MNIIDVKNLSKKYGNFSLNNINFKIPEGTITGLIGGNGAGKTTLIKSILGLTINNTGEIKFLDKTVEESKDKIGVVFDDVYFNPAFTPTILESVMRNSFKNWDKDLFMHYLSKFDLSENQKISTFSKGMKVKLQLAVALAHHPDFLILDEVTSGLDPICRDSILDLLLDFVQKETHSVLISSHNLEDLEKIADKIIILDEGNIILDGFVTDILDNYRIFRGNKRDLKDFKSSNIISVLEDKYSTTALIRTKNSSDALETPKLEEIFKLLVTGEKL